MSTFSELKTRARVNLNDLGVIFHSSDDLQSSIQDAYDDVAAISGCIIKKVTLDWVANLVYYDFAALGVTDFMAVIAIYNNVNNRFLRDDIDLVKLDMIRDNWEVWTGTPQWWVASNFKYTAIVPHYTTAAGTFDLYYMAMAPTVVDTSVPLIPSNEEITLVDYTTMDMLEQSREFVKAQPFWENYQKKVEDLKFRNQNFARRDFLIRL